MGDEGRVVRQEERYVGNAAPVELERQADGADDEIDGPVAEVGRGLVAGRTLGQEREGGLLHVEDVRPVEGREGVPAIFPADEVEGVEADHAPPEPLAAFPGGSVNLALGVQHHGGAGPRPELRIGQVGYEQPRRLAGARRRDGGERTLDGDAHRASGVGVDAELKAARHRGPLGRAGEAGRAERARRIALGLRRPGHETEQDGEGERRQGQQGREGPPPVGEGRRSLGGDVPVGLGDLTGVGMEHKIAEPHAWR